MRGHATGSAVRRYFARPTKNGRGSKTAFVGSRFTAQKRVVGALTRGLDVGPVIRREDDQGFVPGQTRVRVDEFSDLAHGQVDLHHGVAVNVAPATLAQEPAGGVGFVVRGFGGEVQEERRRGSAQEVQSVLQQRLSEVTFAGRRFYTDFPVKGAHEFVVSEHGVALRVPATTKQQLGHP